MPMNVSLTKVLEDFVNRKVESGLYTSASEVVREALRLMEQRDQMREAQLTELRREVARGAMELDNGLGKPLDIEATKAKARKQLAARRARTK